MEPVWRKQNLICSIVDDEVTLTSQPVPTMRDDLLSLFDRKELSKYMTADELTAVDSIGKAEL